MMSNDLVDRAITYAAGDPVKAVEYVSQLGVTSAQIAAAVLGTYDDIAEARAEWCRANMPDDLESELLAQLRTSMMRKIIATVLDRGHVPIELPQFAVLPGATTFDIDVLLCRVRTRKVA
jgi:hypothetical protein